MKKRGTKKGPKVLPRSDRTEEHILVEILVPSTTVNSRLIAEGGNSDPGLEKSTQKPQAKTSDCIIHIRVARGLGGGMEE